MLKMGKENLNRWRRMAMRYFDYAATSFYKPSEIQKAVFRVWSEGVANPGRGGHFAAMQAASMVYEAREKVAELFGGDAERVVFTANATAALNLAIKGLAERGDHILISGLEHNSVLRPVVALKEKGVSYTVVPLDFCNVEKTIKNFMDALRPETAMVVCTAASNVCGYRMPLAAIGHFCAANGLLFIVDASQAAGVFDLTLENTGADVMCAPGHKSLYAPQGSGFLLARKEVKFHTTMEGGSGSASEQIYMPEELPERLEYGTVNVPAIVGLGAACEYAARHREENTAHELELTEKLITGLKEVGAEVFIDFPRAARSPVVAFRFWGENVEDTANWLSEEGFALRAGLHCAPLAHQTLGTLKTGLLRASLGIFTTAEEVDALLLTLNRKMKKNIDKKS